MASSQTITLSLLLLTTLLSLATTHASEYKTKAPETDYDYTPKTLKPVQTYRPGKSLKHYAKTSEQYQFMEGQNAARQAVGLAPLKWDDGLAEYAQWWADQRRNDCSLKHSDGPYGENIFWGSGDADWISVAVESWVVEGSSYDHGSNSCNGGQDCGHYTQIVWKNTSRIGCAKVTCNGDAGVFITCNYDPAGNYIGDRPY